MASNVIPFPVRAAKPDAICPADEIGGARYRVAEIRKLLAEPIEDDEGGYVLRTRQAMLSWWEGKLAELMGYYRSPTSNVIELRRA